MTSNMGDCWENPSYQRYLDYYSQTKYTAWLRQWMYQTCTEFGWYHTSDQPENAYGIKLPIAQNLKVNLN